MLLDAAQSCLLLIDVQEKFIPALQNAEETVKNCRWLIQVAQRLNVPVVASEQYPKGLGHTVAELRELFTDEQLMTKLHFSCTADPSCIAKINAIQRQQIVLIGIESHVCVLQTAIGLRQLGKEVFVVADAVTSRNLYDKKMALKRMRSEGVQIITKEMALFEWLHQSGTDLFKQMSKEFLR